MSEIKLIQQHENALQAIYDHVGFVEDWVVAPLDDKTHMHWHTDGDSVQYAEKVEDFNTGDYYQDDVYKQRFYNKWVYEGENFTMIFCDPHTDGMKWFRLFDNKKKLDELPEEN